MFSKKCIYYKVEYSLGGRKYSENKNKKKEAFEVYRKKFEKEMKPTITKVTVIKSKFGFGKELSKKEKVYNANDINNIYTTRRIKKIKNQSRCI